MKHTAYTSLILIGLAFSLANCQPGTEPSAEQDITENLDSLYLAHGQLLAGTTFQQLSGRLQAALKEGGVALAAAECQLAASSIVDSLSAAYGARIKRTTTQTRNPNNSPTEEEMAALTSYHEAQVQKQTLKPQVVDLGNGQIAFYAPILAAELCLKCHGELGETLAEDDYAYIKERYPEDQAIGYQVGDLRGIWSISFAAESVPK